MASIAAAHCNQPPTSSVRPGLPCRCNWTSNALIYEPRLVALFPSKVKADEPHSCQHFHRKDCFVCARSALPTPSPLTTDKTQKQRRGVQQLHTVLQRKWTHGNNADVTVIRTTGLRRRKWADIDTTAIFEEVVPMYIEFLPR